MINRMRRARRIVSLAPVSIEVQDYDESWPQRAASACREVESALPGVFGTIEHIGSTSVPGLPAKPIIDLMAATTDLEAVRAREADLEALGYRYNHTGMSNRLFYRRPAAGERTHHFHVVPFDTWETQNERLLRDHLRSHPEAAERYGALKQRLAATLSADDYTRAKTELIQELVDAARTQRGLPLVPVWED